MTGTHDVRERLMRATVALLGEGGVQAATPAAIAERAQAGKMSVYRHFSGKDELIAAALADYDIPHRARLLPGGDGDDPLDRVRAMFERAAARADGPTYSGCPYVIARLDVADPRHPAAEAARNHKQGMRLRITELLEQAGVRDAPSRAAVVLMLFDGAVIAAVLEGSGAPLRLAASALDRLLVESSG